MCLSWVYNSINRLSLCIIAVFAFSVEVVSQSVAHSSVPYPMFPDAQFVMPDLPDDLDFSDDKNEAYVFAYPFEVSIRKQDIAPVLKNDTLYYNVSVLSKDAYSLNLIFEDVSIPEGAHLSVYGADSADFKTYTSDDVFLAGVLATPLVQGEVIYVCYAEKNNLSKSGSWTIKQVAHDYKNAYLKPSLMKSTASSCNVDINCDEGADWQVEKQAVCKMLIQGVTLCTGTLVNNTAKDMTPYIITANHCVASESKALRTVFYFDYENETCGTASAKPSKTISGSSLVATSPTGKVDFSLLKMSEIPPKYYNPYYAGWNVASSIGKGTACIHHPKGDVKKISVDKDKPSTGTLSTGGIKYVEDGNWLISRWETGTTEGGSSGSPLFDNEHHVIGMLSGGMASCDEPVNDYFAKISYAWDYYDVAANQVKAWLDPLGIGADVCQGYNPYMLAANILSNVNTTDSLRLFTFGDNADGYWSGCNEIGWRSVAERFYTKKSIYSLTLCGTIDTTKDLSDVRICVWSGSSQPEKELYSTELTKKYIHDSVTIFIPLKEPITPDGTFWVGYQMKHDTRLFTGFVANVESDGTLFVKHPRSWVNTQTIGFPAHLGISLGVTDRPDTVLVNAYERPFFANNIVAKEYPMATKELFAIDSIGNTTKQTSYYSVLSEGVARWTGPNEIHVDCVGNSVSITEPTCIRSVKVGVLAIPDETATATVTIWRGDLSGILAQKQVKNSDVKEGNFNQIHLDTLLYVDTSVVVGVCFDSVNYEKSLSIGQYYDVESRMDGMFCVDGVWRSFQQFSMPYNVAVQPVTARSRYHFNPDSAKILTYPINIGSDVKFEKNNTCVIYPNPCTDKCMLTTYPQMHTTATIRIYTESGNFVHSAKYKSIGGIFEIPMNKMPQGILILKFESDGVSYTKRIIHVCN